MPPLLVDAKYLTYALSLASAKAARSLMREWEVPFICLGPGRGRGLRWEWEAVQKAIKERTISLAPKEPRRNKRSSSTDADVFFSKPWSEALKELEERRKLRSQGYTKK